MRNLSLMICSVALALASAGCASTQNVPRTGGQRRRHGRCFRPRLTDSAERDYFTLRERIVTVTKQVGYLQDYIKEQCLK